MGHGTTPRFGASLLAFAFFCGTAYVLFEDVIRHDAPLTTAHILTGLALIGAFAAGKLFLGELVDRHLVTALGCGVLFLAATAYIVTASGARNAEGAANKVKRIEANNAERARVVDERQAAQAMLDKARADVARECASGDGTRCKGRKATASVYEAAVRGHDARLAEIGPEITPNAGYIHAGRIFAALPYVTVEAEAITARLELVMPFVLVLIAEIGTLVFGHIAFRGARRLPSGQPAAERVARVIEPAETAQTSFPIREPLPSPSLFASPLPDNEDDPEPPKPGHRERQVRDFVTAHIARHGRPPRTRDVMRECALPKASASRWRARALAA